MNLLQHEMRISTLFKLGDGKFKAPDVKMPYFIVKCLDFQWFTLFNHCNLPVIQIGKIIGIVDD